MSEKKEKRNKKMVYTREQHIPIGEAVIDEHGEMALRVKKPKGSEMETISIGTLLSDMAKAVCYIPCQHRSAITATLYKTIKGGFTVEYMLMKQRQVQKIHEKTSNGFLMTAVPERLTS